MSALGQMLRSHRARKAHRCDLCRQAIEPGSVYLVGVTLPGEGRYAIGGGDYEPVDWPFTALKAHPHCYEREEFGE